MNIKSNYCDGGGISARACAQESYIAPYSPKSKPIQIFLHPSEGRRCGDEAGSDVGEQGCLFQIRTRDSPDGAAQLGGVIEIECLNGANGAGANVCRGKPRTCRPASARMESLARASPPSRSSLASAWA